MDVLLLTAASETEERLYTIGQVLGMLQAKARPDQLEGMFRYGMKTKGRLGTSVPVMRDIAKQVGKDHSLALALWDTGVAEARIVAAMVDDPEQVTEEQMECWVKDIDSWDVCDQLCMNLFVKTPLAWKKILDWSKREEEFVKRAAFALTACLAWNDRKAEDEAFVRLLPVIRRGATDERNFVKKAVNWALRNIGKRNIGLNEAALKTAKELLKMDSRSARWVASDTIRELESRAVQGRLRKAV